MPLTRTWRYGLPARVYRSHRSAWKTILDHPLPDAPPTRRAGAARTLPPAELAQLQARFRSEETERNARRARVRPTHILGGYAVFWNRWSRPCPEAGGHARTRYHFGTFNLDNVELWAEHKRPCLARVSDGSLRLSQDACGLWLEAEVPDAILVAVANGRYSGLSICGLEKLRDSDGVGGADVAFQDAVHVNLLEISLTNRPACESSISVWPVA